MKENLEIRGIHRQTLISYLNELHAKGDINQTNFHAANWSCFVSVEDSFRLLQSDIPIVRLTFRSNDPSILSEVIRAFRKKTFRAGG